MNYKSKPAVTGMLMVVPLTAIISVVARTDSHKFDATATYKSKCAGCHGAHAQKSFDAAKSDDELVQAILKGKKKEKPPHMPGYETKGINAEHAKQLLDHMRALKH